MLVVFLLAYLQDMARRDNKAAALLSLLAISGEYGSGNTVWSRPVAETTPRCPLSA
eukprot:gene14335-586_t